MTAFLQCDGCGAVVGERAEDDDPTSRWWCLSPGPTIGGALLGLGTLTLDIGHDDEDEPTEELPPPDPPRHYCSLDCLRAWAARSG